MRNGLITFMKWIQGRIGPVTCLRTKGPAGIQAEGFELFEGLIRVIEENVVQMLFRITDPARRHCIQPGASRRAPGAQRERIRDYQYTGADKEAGRSFAAMEAGRVNLAAAAAPKGGTESRREPVRVVEKIRPNDPCPCGSGKKYTKCCGGVNT